MNLSKQLMDACQSSGRYNRFMTLRAVTDVEVYAQFKNLGIKKIQYCQFEIGSDYATRMENRDDDFQGVSRPSFYGNETENGVLRYLLKTPEKKYIWVWRSAEKAYKSVYIDRDGTVLNYATVQPMMRKRSASTTGQRVFKLENVFSIAVNNEVFSDAELTAKYGHYIP